MLIVAILVLAQAAATASDPAAGNLSEALYEASIDATGSKLCDRERAALYLKQFNRRYGERLRKLSRYHVARFGNDPDLIITTDCRWFGRAVRQEDREHALAMERFEPRLRELERRFGPAEETR